MPEMTHVQLISRIYGTYLAFLRINVNIFGLKKRNVRNLNEKLMNLMNLM